MRHISFLKKIQTKSTFPESAKPRVRCCCDVLVALAVQKKTTEKKHFFQPGNSFAVVTFTHFRIFRRFIIYQELVDQLTAV